MTEEILNKIKEAILEQTKHKLHYLLYLQLRTQCDQEMNATDCDRLYKFVVKLSPNAFDDADKAFHNRFAKHFSKNKSTVSQVLEYFPSCAVNDFIICDVHGESYFRENLENTSCENNQQEFEEQSTTNTDTDIPVDIPVEQFSRTILTDRMLRNIYQVPEEWVTRKFEATVWDGKIRSKGEWVPPEPLSTKQDVEEIVKLIPTFISKDVRYVREVQPTDKTVVINIFDHHYGMKLADGSYSLEIAEDLFSRTLEYFLSGEEIPLSTISTVILPVGNDFFHVDNGRNTTTKGTPQGEIDGLFRDVVKRGAAFLISKIYELYYSLSENCRIVIPIVPGNHDRETVENLALILHHTFSNCQRIEILFDDSLPYQIVRSKNNLIGFYHGDEQIRDVSVLSPLMMSQRRDFHECIAKHWHLGHFHSLGVNKTVLGRHGVDIMFWPSLIPANAYSKGVGYVNTPRAANFVIYDNNGFRGTRYVSYELLMKTERKVD